MYIMYIIYVYLWVCNASFLITWRNEFINLIQFSGCLELSFFVDNSHEILGNETRNDILFLWIRLI